MNVLSLFDGISTGQLALKELGIEVNNYYASEIDGNAIKVTWHHFPNTKQLGDIRNIIPENLPKIDLLIGGSPCQSFSNAGKGEGFDGTSGLFYEYVKILNKLNPKYFLLENVKMKKEWQDIITKELGVKPIEINSSLVSGQNRVRLYWTNIKGITIPKDRNILFSNLVNKDYKFKPLTKWFFSKWGDKRKIDTLKTIKAAKSFCITTNKSHSKNYYLNEDRTMARMLEIDEIEKLQTMPIGYTNVLSKTAAHKAIGNGWTLEVIKHIFKNLQKSAPCLKQGSKE